MGVPVDLDAVRRDLDAARNALRHGVGIDSTGVTALSVADAAEYADPLIDHCTDLVAESVKLRAVASASISFIILMRTALADDIPRNVLIAALDAAMDDGSGPLGELAGP